MKEGYFADLGRCFKGTAAWTNWLVMVYALVATGFLVYLTIGLFDATSTRDQILHATGVIISGLMIMTMKIWFWTQMNRRAVEARLDEMRSSKR